MTPETKKHLTRVAANLDPSRLQPSMYFNRATNCYCGIGALVHEGLGAKRPALTSQYRNAATNKLCIEPNIREAFEDLFDEAPVHLRHQIIKEFVAAYPTKRLSAIEEPLKILRNLPHNGVEPAFTDIWKRFISILSEAEPATNQACTSRHYWRG